MKADGKPVTNAGTGSMLLASGAANVEAIKRIEGVIYTPNDQAHRPRTRGPVSGPGVTD